MILGVPAFVDNPSRVISISKAMNPKRFSIAGACFPTVVVWRSVVFKATGFCTYNGCILPNLENAQWRKPHETTTFGSWSFMNKQWYPVKCGFCADIFHVNFECFLMVPYLLFMSDWVHVHCSRTAMIPAFTISWLLARTPAHLDYSAKLQCSSAKLALWSPVLLQLHAILA